MLFVLQSALQRKGNKNRINLLRLFAAGNYFRFLLFISFSIQVYHAAGHRILHSFASGNMFYLFYFLSW